jgi:HEAT repeat protein
LGQLGGERAIEALLAALKTDNSDSVRGRAASALDQLGSERAIEALLGALKTDNSGVVRGNAASALGQIGGERAIEALLEALKTINGSGLIAHAAWGLGNLAGNRKIKTNQAVFKDAAEHLRKLLNQQGFDEEVWIADNHYSRRYDVIWEALWNVCQKQGIV